MRSAIKPANRSAEDQNRWVAHLDRTIAEVCEAMLRQPCAPTGSDSHPGRDISAHILFSGALEGHCAIQLSSAAAYRLTDALLGATGDWDDEMIDDAVGELCNMIAGGWKSRLGAPASLCHLSVPVVSRGLTRVSLYNNTATRRFYTFSGSVLEVALALALEKRDTEVSRHPSSLGPCYFTTD